MKCEIGDIVLVNNFTYNNGQAGGLHPFVIMNANNDEFDVVIIDYLGFIVSSVIRKNNNEDEKFPYNEPIHPDEENGLKDESHVKCDQIFKISPNNIIMKLGTIDQSQYDKFLELYEVSTKIREFA